VVEGRQGSALGGARERPQPPRSPTTNAGEKATGGDQSSEAVRIVILDC
jgi:hypothetical protein